LRHTITTSKLYHRVPNALAIHFFIHFFYGMYRLATIHSNKLNRRNFCVWNRHFGSSALQLYRMKKFIRHV